MSVYKVEENILNNLNCGKKYNDSIFKIPFRARNPYHISVMESLFIKTFLAKNKIIWSL